MKKATVPAVAQPIKSSQQLSPLQGLAPAKSCKPPLKSSCSGLKLDAAQAHQHLDLLGLEETCTNIRLIPHKGRRGGAQRKSQGAPREGSSPKEVVEQQQIWLR